LVALFFRRHVAARVAFDLGKLEAAPRLIAERLSKGSDLALCRLLAALAILTDALFNWGDFPSCFRVRTDSADRLVVCFDHFADLPVGFSRRRFDQLGDQVALLLDAQMAAMDVGTDDVGVGIAVRLDFLAHIPAERAGKDFSLLKLDDKARAEKVCRLAALGT